MVGNMDPNEIQMEPLLEANNTPSATFDLEKAIGPLDVVIGVAGLTNAGKTAICRALGNHTMGEVRHQCNSTPEPVIAVFHQLSPPSLAHNGDKARLVDMPGFDGIGEGKVLEGFVRKRLLPTVDILLYTLNAHMVNHSAEETYNRMLKDVDGDASRLYVIINRADELHTAALITTYETALELFSPSPVYLTCAAKHLRGQDHDQTPEDIAEISAKWDRRMRDPTLRGLKSIEELREELVAKSVEIYESFARDPRKKKAREERFLNWAQKIMAVAGVATASGGVAGIATWIPGMTAWGAAAGPVLLTTPLGIIALVPVAITAAAASVPVIAFAVYNNIRKNETDRVETAARNLSRMSKKNM